MKTFKELNKEFEKARTNKEKEALRQERDILYIATRGGKFSKAGEQKIKTAAAGIRLLKKLNRLIDRELIISNDERYYDEKLLKDLEEIEDNLVKEINDILKPLKVGVAFNTYAYLYDITEGRGYMLGLNFIF